VTIIRRAVGIAVLLLGTATAAFAQTPSLNWGSEVNPSQCPTDQGYRYLEINVTRKVEADFAPGANHFDVTGTPTAPDGWAAREYNQHIQVWKIGVVEPPPDGGNVGGERYCALVRYQGSFVSNAGTGPNDNGSLAAGVDGTFEGGYRLIFNADENYTAPTRGHIGTFDVSTSATDWITSYFVNIGVRTGTSATPGIPAPAWWGWVYHGGHNGTWVNAIGGNVQGNISGAP
jgi:hypothetical protein